MGISNFSANAQINNLSENEYIKFDSVKVVDISGTNGDVSEMQNLFNNTLKVEKGFNDAVEHWIKFSTSSLCLEFYNGVEENSKIIYDLASIDVENNSSSILIKGKEIKIGDNESLLSNLNSRNVNGQKIFSFSANNLDEYAFIYVDISTRKVIKIGYDGNLL